MARQVVEVRVLVFIMAYDLSPCTRVRTLQCMTAEIEVQWNTTSTRVIWVHIILIVVLPHEATLLYFKTRPRLSFEF